MTIAEITGLSLADWLQEAVPHGPLSPEQARARAEKVKAASAKLADTRKKNSERLCTAQQKLAAL